MDSILLDGKVIGAEYVQYFENSFRSITMRKINTTRLERGMHCLESNGRYLLFIFGGNRKNYGYAYAFNAYPTETLKWTMRNNANSYHQDIFGVSFITLFPWMTVENASDNFNTDLTLDILNPHPYMFAKVRISYCNGSKGNLIEMLYNIKPYTHHKLKMNKIMMTKLYNAYNVSIYKSNYDSRITITSTIPISVTQSCFIGNRIGDSFTVLPLKMAGRNYSFSLPKSVANNSHSIVYLLPSYRTTKISVIAKVDGNENFYNIKATIARNSSIFAYYGSGEELSMNLWSDKSFQVIITLQQLLIIHNTESRLDFGCTMAVPIPSQSACSMKKDMSLHDMHHLLIAQHYNHSGFFTMTPSDRKCSAYYVDFFPRKKSATKEIKRLKFEPATMQHYFQLSAQIFSDFSTMYCRNDYIQIYYFGSSNMKGSYIDFIPSTLQYVTGRSHFVACHYQNWVLIFMDKNAINDIEMDGVFISNNYIYEMLSPNNSGYFALQTVHSTVRLHYVQSTGYYAVHILSDTLKNDYRNVTENREQKSHSNVTSRELTTKKISLKSSAKPFEKIVCGKELLFSCKSIAKNENESDTIMLDQQNVAKGGQK
ncbi:unnamed protein product [Wuchereria bancrofti]|uniref:IgGFc-binding protein N-terminal domain-containing protein n=2 Tax=Wuchereria bancrofti TaxID=6293 RepID=A0A3P7DPT6_WUCBA|nr:unnamed protein product [Wuchereria bancrofti]